MPRHPVKKTPNLGSYSTRTRLLVAESLNNSLRHVARSAGRPNEPDPQRVEAGIHLLDLSLRPSHVLSVEEHIGLDASRHLTSRLTLDYDVNLCGFQQERSIRRLSDHINRAVGPDLPYWVPILRPIRAPVRAPEVKREGVTVRTLSQRGVRERLVAASWALLSEIVSDPLDSRHDLKQFVQVDDSATDDRRDASYRAAVERGMQEMDDAKRFWQHDVSVRWLLADALDYLATAGVGTISAPETPNQPTQTETISGPPNTPLEKALRIVAAVGLAYPEWFDVLAVAIAEAPLVVALSPTDTGGRLEIEIAGQRRHPTPLRSRAMRVVQQGLGRPLILEYETSLPTVTPHYALRFDTKEDSSGSDKVDTVHLSAAASNAQYSQGREGPDVIVRQLSELVPSLMTAADAAAGVGAGKPSHRSEDQKPQEVDIGRTVRSARVLAKRIDAWRARRDHQRTRILRESGISETDGNFWLDRVRQLAVEIDQCTQSSAIDQPDSQELLPPVDAEQASLDRMRKLASACAGLVSATNLAQLSINAATDSDPRSDVGYISTRSQPGSESVRRLPPRSTLGGERRIVRFRLALMEEPMTSTQRVAVGLAAVLLATWWLGAFMLATLTGPDWGWVWHQPDVEGLPPAPLSGELILALLIAGPTVLFAPIYVSVNGRIRSMLQTPALVPIVLGGLAVGVISVSLASRTPWSIEAARATTLAILALWVLGLLPLTVEVWRSRSAAALGNQRLQHETGRPAWAQRSPRRGLPRRVQHQVSGWVVDNFGSNSGVIWLRYQKQRKRWRQRTAAKKKLWPAGLSFSAGERQLGRWNHKGDASREADVEQSSGLAEPTAVVAAGVVARESAGSRASSDKAVDGTERGATGTYLGYRGSGTNIAEVVRRTAEGLLSEPDLTTRTRLIEVAHQPDTPTQQSPNTSQGDQGNHLLLVADGVARTTVLSRRTFLSHVDRSSPNAGVVASPEGTATRWSFRVEEGSPQVLANHKLTEFMVLIYGVEPHDRSVSSMLAVLTEVSWRYMAPVTLIHSPETEPPINDVKGLKRCDCFTAETPHDQAADAGYYTYQPVNQHGEGCPRARCVASRLVLAVPRGSSRAEMLPGLLASALAGIGHWALLARGEEGDPTRPNWYCHASNDDLPPELKPEPVVGQAEEAEGGREPTHVACPPDPGLDARDITLVGPFRLGALRTIMKALAGSPLTHISVLVLDRVTVVTAQVHSRPHINAVLSGLNGSDGELTARSMASLSGYEACVSPIVTSNRPNAGGQVRSNPALVSPNHESGLTIWIGFSVTYESPGIGEEASLRAERLLDDFNGDVLKFLDTSLRDVAHRYRPAHGPDTGLPQPRLRYLSRRRGSGNATSAIGLVHIPAGLAQMLVASNGGCPAALGLFCQDVEQEWYRHVMWLGSQKDPSSTPVEGRCAAETLSLPGNTATEASPVTEWGNSGWTVLVEVAHRELWMHRYSE